MGWSRVEDLVLAGLRFLCLAAPAAYLAGCLSSPVQAGVLGDGGAPPGQSPATGTAKVARDDVTRPAEGGAGAPSAVRPPTAGATRPVTNIPMPRPFRLPGQPAGVPVQVNRQQEAAVDGRPSAAGRPADEPAKAVRREEEAAAEGPTSPEGRPAADEPARAIIQEKALVDEDILPVACSSCGQYHLGGPAGAPGGSCGPTGCIPGRTKTCHHAEASTYFGRFASNLYHCLCCPDPCYEPRWVPEANAAFFVDPARPRTQKRLRWDHAFTLWFPDRSEYFWARSYRGPGPQPRKPTAPNRKPIYGERTISYDQLYVYIEAALPRFGFFTEIPYRSTSPSLTPHHAGFSDMNLGTKSLLLDCDLLQLTLQFKTYLPIGSISDGLGNGHVSLEPSLLMAVHLAPETYLQGQIAEWVPIGGDPQYAGAILHYHLSMNQVLCRLLPDIPLIGTLEFNGWSFQDGAFTAPVLGPQNSSGDSYLSLGPGLRMSICDFIDFGVGTAFALDRPNWGEPLIRSEIRIFY